MNNLALFVTHNLFLTEDQIVELLAGKTVGLIGCCVPVWVDAKTGRTNEPASEIFCEYLIHNSQDKQKDIDIIKKKGYEIFVPNSDEWKNPPELDFEKISLMNSEDRMAFLKERDKWWFNNPRPPNVENLRGGYLRFEVKKTKQKVQRKEYSAQHVIEIAKLKRLEDSLTF
jgi:hypothetical protein